METRSTFEIEPHDAGYTANSGPDATLELAGIQHRRCADGVFRSFYAFRLTDRARAKAIRYVKQARKALRLGKTPRLRCV